MFSPNDWGQNKGFSPISKIEDLDDLETSYRSVEKINENQDKIVEAFNNTLSRDGSGPNNMEAPIDMDGNRIVNLGPPVDNNDAARLIDVLTLGGGGGGSEPIDLSPYAKKDLTNIANPDFYAKGIASGLGTGSGGGGPVEWDDIIGKPSTYPAATPIPQSSITNLTGDLAGKAPVSHNHTASQVSDFTAASRAVIGSSVVAGTNTTVSYNPGTGLTTINSTASGGGGADVLYTLVDDFGGVGDNITDNKDAFDAAEASDAQRIYLSEGTFYTINSMNSIQKYYWGPGKIRFSSGETVAGNYVNIQTPPTPGGTGTGPSGWFGGDTSGVVQEYRRIGNLSTRKSLTAPYFDPAVIPSSVWLYNYAGWSGATAHLASPASPGATTVTIKGTTTGISVGDTLGFTTLTTVGQNAISTSYNDTVTVTGKTTNTITFSPALTTNYGVNAVITHGNRTMNLHKYDYVRNYGGGDVYVHLARIQQNYQPLPSQIHWAETSTVGQYGGDVIFNTSGTYGTGWESYYADQGNDVAMIGQVNNYVRDNDTAAWGGHWIGILEASGGSKPADAGVVIAGPWRVGIDTTRGDFSSNSQAAIQMAMGQRLYFNSWVNPSGRGSVAGSPYGILYGNTPGDAYMTYGQDGTSAYLDTFVGGTYRTRLRSNGTFNFNGSMNIASDITGQQDIIAYRDLAAIGKIRISGFSSPVYFWFDGVNLRATKNNGASSVVIV